MYHAITRRKGIYTRKRDLAAFLRYYKIARRDWARGIRPPHFLITDYSARKGL
jgi:hypothetical protein